MKTIEVKMHCPEKAYREPTYSVFITGEAEELGGWRYAIRMDSLIETVHGSLAEMGAEDFRDGFRIIASDNILNTKFKLLFGETKLGKKVSCTDLVYEKDIIERRVDGTPDSGEEGYNGHVIGAYRVSVTIESFAGPNVMNRFSFWHAQVQENIDNNLNIYINAKIDVGYGNAVYISGEGDYFDGWRIAYPLYNVDADTWAITLPNKLNNKQCKFYLGEWGEASNLKDTNSLQELSSDDDIIENNKIYTVNKASQCTIM